MNTSGGKNHKFSNKKHQNNRKQNRNRYQKKRRQDINLAKENYLLFKGYRKAQATIINYAQPSSEEQLTWKLSSEHLNIKEMLGLVRYRNVIFLNKLKHILDNEVAIDKIIDDSDLLQSEEFTNRSLEVLLDRLSQSRKEIENLCKKSTDDDWVKKATFDGNEKSFAELMQALIEISETYLDDIFLNLQRHQPWYKPEEQVETTEENEAEEAELTTETEDSSNDTSESDSNDN